MRILYTVCIIVSFFAPSVFLSAQTAEDNHKKEKLHILNLEQQWLAAEMRFDTFFISSILDSGYMGISEYGVFNRQEEIGNIYFAMQERQKNNIQIDTFEIMDEKVNLHADAAVVTFVLQTFRNENGIPIQRRTRYYDVWVKKHGRWLAVSSQGSVSKE